MGAIMTTVKAQLKQSQRKTQN